MRHDPATVVAVGLRRAEVVAAAAGDRVRDAGEAAVDLHRLGDDRRRTGQRRAPTDHHQQPAVRSGRARHRRLVVERAEQAVEQQREGARDQLPTQAVEPGAAHSDRVEVVVLVDDREAVIAAETRIRIGADVGRPVAAGLRVRQRRRRPECAAGRVDALVLHRAERWLRLRPGDAEALGFTHAGDARRRHGAVAAEEDRAADQLPVRPHELTAHVGVHRRERASPDHQEAPRARCVGGIGVAVGEGAGRQSDRGADQRIEHQRIRGPVDERGRQRQFEAAVAPVQATRHRRTVGVDAGDRADVHATELVTEPQPGCHDVRFAEVADHRVAHQQVAAARGPLLEPPRQRDPVAAHLVVFGPPVAVPVVRLQPDLLRWHAGCQRLQRGAAADRERAQVQAASRRHLRPERRVEAHAVGREADPVVAAAAEQSGAARIGLQAGGRGGGDRSRDRLHVGERRLGRCECRQGEHRQREQGRAVGHGGPRSVTSSDLEAVPVRRSGRLAARCGRAQLPARLLREPLPWPAAAGSMARLGRRPGIRDRGAAQLGLARRRVPRA